MADNQGGSEDAPPLARGNSRAKQRLSILQWNCRSITGKVPFLLDYMQTHPQVDVLMLQSLNVQSRALPQLDGYYYPPVTGVEGDRVMVATYVSTRLTYSPVVSPAGSVGCRLATCAVSIPTKGSNRQTSLVNVYYPAGSSKIAEVAWLKNLNPETGSWVVAGDFNVSHRLWDATATHSSGLHLADAVSDSNLTMLNDGSVTRIGQTGQRCSAIDLTMVTTDLFHEADWSTGTDHLQSDHLPLHIVLGEADPGLAENDRTPKYQYQRANWDLFESVLNEQCKTVDPRDANVDTYLENIRNMILKGADAAIPKRAPGARGVHQHSSKWWNEECAEATSAKRRALRTFQANMSEENKEALRVATHTCQSVVDSARREHWERFCLEKIKGPEDAPKVWKRVNALRRRARQPERPLLIGDQYTRGVQEKADALAETFSRASQTKHLPAEVARYRAEEETRFETPGMDNSTPFNGDLTLKELKTAVSGLGSASKATGEDPISYHLIRRFPESMMEILLEFYQTCWESGAIPVAWKDALVIAIPKEGKPRHLPTSYRPIALTPHLGKVYERLIKNRLEYLLEKQGILPVCQAGFRKGRNCMEHVVRLSEHVKKALTGGRTTVATFFDIKRAFDTVWHAKLLDKMQALGITGRLYKFVQTFLDSRRMAVKVGDSKSKSHTLDMGVPQGSVVAPTLFSIMLHDIQRVSRPGLSISLYADDLAIWADCPANKNHRRQALERFRQSIDRIQTYMKSNGFELSAEKTVLMVFTRDVQSRGDFWVRIGGNVVQPSKQAKFLGVTITQSLTWTPHVRSLITKARRATSMIKLLKGETWVTPRSLVHLTRALVRSRLTYGHEAFITATDSLWLDLERAELAALKAALGLPRYAINDLVYQEVGWLPLREESRLRCAHFEARACTVPNTVREVLGTDFAPAHCIQRNKLARKRPRLFRSTAPLHTLTADIWEQSQTRPDQVAPIPPPTFPPWELEKPTVVHSLGDGLTKDTDSLYLATLAMERVKEQLGNHLQIYTDGSVLQTGEVGCALVIPDLKITRRYKLPAGISIFTAELYAIYMACTIANDLPNPPLGVAILSDSKSALQALAAGGTRNRGDLQAEILFLAHQLILKGSDVFLMWLPSHTGIKGNEFADKEAKEAAKDGTAVDLKLSLTEIKSATHRTARKMREEFLKQRCETHGWLFLPAGQRRQPQLSRRALEALRRIRTVSTRCTHVAPKCPCGTDISLHHALTGCMALAPSLCPLWDFRSKHKLRVQDFLQPHPDLGELPMQVLTRSLLASEIGQWF